MTYYIDYDTNGKYCKLVRKSDEAILYANEDLDVVIAEAKSRNIIDLVIF